MLWLSWLAATALLPFHAHHHVVPAAGWLAPVFLLRWSRRASRRWAWSGVVGAIAIGDLLAFQGGYLPFPPVLLPAMAIAGGLVWSVPYLVDRWSCRRLGPLAAMLVFPAAMATLDGLNARWSPLGAWGSPAFSQDPGGALAQIASVTGILGITFLLHWLAPVLEGWWEHGWAPAGRRPVYASAATLAVVLGFGTWRLHASSPGSLRVAAVALSAERYADAWRGLRVPAIARQSTAERAAVRAQLERALASLLARTDEAAQAGARLVAWPEGVPVLEEDLDDWLARARALARDRGLHLVVGPEVILRTSVLPFARNLSILIEPRGRELWRYDKSHPVPGIEDGRLRSGTGAPPVVDTALGRLATAICFDLDFGPLVRQAGLRGVDLLVAPADDWPAIRTMHPRMAAFRAVENGFALLRPASQGESVAVDAEGRIRARSASLDGGDGAFVTDLPLPGEGWALAPRLGDGALAASSAALAVLLLAARRAGSGDPRKRVP